MLDFDPSVGWTSLEERLRRTESPRQRQIIQCVVDHVKAEVAGNVDGLMATLVPDPQYHFWNKGVDVGPKGRDEVRSYYEAYVASGAAMFESVKERIVVDDDAIALENLYHNLVSGQLAKSRGYSVPDTTGHYLVHFRSTIWWSFAESGLAIGEDSYSTVNPDEWDHVAVDDLPQCYIDYLSAIGKLDVASTG